MGTGNLIGNLLDLDFGNNNPAPSNPKIEKKTNEIIDLLSMDIEPESFNFVKKDVFLAPENAQGLELLGAFSKRYQLNFSSDGNVFMDLTFSNKTTSLMFDFGIQFNVNTYF
jgi:hypothetical protein